MNRILVIEDEERISSFIAKGLRAAGYLVTVAHTAAEGFMQATNNVADLIILDLGLPDEDGLSLLARLRQVSVDEPVIVLTARSGKQDTVTALRSGADDYMVKPFHFDELLERVRLRMRSDSGATESAILEYADLSMDLLRHQLTVAGSPVALSAREFSLAEAFMRNPEQVLSREQLLSLAWGYDFDPGSNVVDVYVRYLRHKLGSGYLHTVRGVGYRLSAAAER